MDDPPMKFENPEEIALHMLLKKQLNKKASLLHQAPLVNQFEPAGSYVHLPATIQGKFSLDDYLKLNSHREYIAKLSNCGLDEDEIALYISYKNNEKTNRILDPRVMEEKLKVILQKIESSDGKISSYESESKEVNNMDDENLSPFKRMRMVDNIENKNASFLSEIRHPSKLYKEIAELSDKISKRPRKKHKICKETPQSTKENPSLSDKLTKDELCQFHVSTVINKDEIASNRLSIEDIRKMPKFSNFHPGTPSKILYIKNLHSQVDVRELSALFSQFSQKEPLHFRIMKGVRFHGQAFVTFPDVQSAIEAQNMVNGYKLRNRPMIIAFGKNETKL